MKKTLTLTITLDDEMENRVECAINALEIARLHLEQSGFCNIGNKFLYGHDTESTKIIGYITLE